MKGMKTFTQKGIPRGLMILALAGAVFLSMHFYRLAGNYADAKKKPETPSAPVSVSPPPSFHAFSTDDPIKFALFTFNRRELLPPPETTQTEAPPNYVILGMVKQNQLFLAVRGADNIIRMVPQGGAINGDHTVVSLRPGFAELTDAAGRRWTHKLFKMINIEEINYGK